MQNDNISGTMIFSVKNLKMKQCKQTYRLLESRKLCKIVTKHDEWDLSFWCLVNRETAPYPQKHATII